MLCLLALSFLTLPSLVGRSVCWLKKSVKKSVKNCQKRGFETKNDCTSEHQDCDQCTIVHTSIKQSLLSQEAAIKRQTISTKFKDQSHIKWNMHQSILHGLLTAHTRSFLWPKPHLLPFQFIILYHLLLIQFLNIIFFLKKKKINPKYSKYS